MTATMILQFVRSQARDALPWWQGLPLPTKVAGAASALVLASMVYLGLMVAEHVRDNVAQRSAAALAHYMDSFVEGIAQELSTRSALSVESQKALERLLSPASVNRPIVAFRIWKGDTIVFSNDKELVGKTFPRTAARERALQGQFALELDQPDGDDDEQVRSLKLPILEVYAPVHERGTGRVIALVETYEIAVALKSEIFAGQLNVWAAFIAVALTVVVLLVSMANTGNSLLGRIAELSRLRTESEQHRQRISKASLHMSGMSERALQHLGEELYDGPAQLVALAMLKFDSLEQLAAKAQGAMPPSAVEQIEELEAVRNALNEALRGIRGLAGGLPLPDIAQLSVADTFLKVARRYERRTGLAVRFESHGLPEQLPFPIKACLYRFAMEGLDNIGAVSGGRPQTLSASCDRERIVLQIVGSDLASDSESQPRTDLAVKLRSLRDRIEAVGGKICFAATSSGQVSLVAELSLGDMEPANG